MTRAPLLLGALLIGLWTAAPAVAHEEHERDLPPAPELEYEPPAPGSYELPSIDRVSDRVLLDPRGQESPLLGLGRGQVALVSFMYRSCTDAGGCPMALAVLRRLDRELSQRPTLAARVRLVTVSFDPARDTPQRMGELRALMTPRSDWRFLTAPSRQVIGPVLADFGQDALERVTEAGEPWGMRHVLKVFLVDERGDVRNVYSTGFLRWQLVLNDIETILDERAIELNHGPVR